VRTWGARTEETVVLVVHRHRSEQRDITARLVPNRRHYVGLSCEHMFPSFDEARNPRDMDNHTRTAPSQMSGILRDLRELAFPVDKLASLPGNPRRGHVQAVAQSYRTFGQRKPIVVRPQGDGGVVLAGNTQLAAARKLGWTHIAVVWVEDDDITAK